MATMKPDADFFVDDDDPAVVRAAFDAGVKGKTRSHDALKALVGGGYVRLTGPNDTAGSWTQDAQRLSSYTTPLAARSLAPA